MRELTAPRRGFTLLELLVSITILAITSAIATLVIRRAEQPNPNDPWRILVDSQRAALGSGRDIVVRVLVDERPAYASIRSDGSVVADSMLEIERLSGRHTRARQ